MAKLAVIFVVPLLISCSLVTQTQISFWNDTPSYTFLAIKIGTVDYQTALTPGSLPTQYFPIAAGTYTLYTQGSDGYWYQWPTQQTIERGYSYELIFAVDVSNNLYYSTYVTMVQ